MDVHEVFNEKLRGLVNDLVTIRPDVPDFAMLRNALTLGATLDRTMPQRCFHRFAAPYADQIRARDERFFLDHRYDDVAGVATDVVDKIKGVWRTLADADKCTIWRYFQVLLILSDAC